MKLINLACGPVYIVDRLWTNVDFASANSNVIGCDLLKSLPFPNNSFDAVYSSHFLEHIPRDSVKDFLLECKRILRPEGYIRLVLPDCQEMFSAYLEMRTQGLHREADFVIVEIIDQCVRQESGGELSVFYNMIDQMDGQERIYWSSFVSSRNGEGLDPVVAISKCKESPGFIHSKATSIRAMPGRLYKRLRNRMHQTGLWLLKSSFRRQNVSFTAIGEKHCWLWDFHQLKQSLEGAGFTYVTRQTHLTSSIPCFPFYPLDSTRDGQPRKGAESMFVEARIS